MLGPNLSLCASTYHTNARRPQRELRTARCTKSKCSNRHGSGLTNHQCLSITATASSLRCNSIVSHRTNIKVSAARKVDPRRTAVHALNAVEAAFAAASGDAISTANMPLGPAGNIMSRHGHRDHDGGELPPRSKSIVAPASPPRSSYPSREERLTRVDRRPRSPHRCTPDTEGSRGLAVDKRTLRRSFLSRTFPERTRSRAERERSESNDHHREEEGMAAPTGALRYVPKTACLRRCIPWIGRTKPQGPCTRSLRTFCGAP